MALTVRTSILHNLNSQILFINFSQGYTDEKELPATEGLMNTNLKAVNSFLVVCTTGFITTLLHPFLPLLMLGFDTVLHKFWFNSIFPDL